MSQIECHASAALVREMLHTNAMLFESEINIDTHKYTHGETINRKTDTHTATTRALS